MSIDVLTAVAERIADGGGADWTAAASGPLSPRERVLLAHMRSIAAIADVYSTSRGEPGADNLAPLQPPCRWGALEVVQQIGGGRFGDVYRAWDPSLHREVALKILKQDAGADEVIDEGRLAARVQHPNVVTIYGAQRIDGRTGLWMELVRGRTLEVELAERGTLDAGALDRVAVELCRALSAVHEAGLVHRDVKATNVMRDERGRIVLGDFGTGREIEADRSGLAGTPAYLAPEIFAGQAATPQSDLYSLGVLLFRLATGRYPIDGASIGEIRAAHAAGRRVSLATERRDLRRRFVAAVDRALDPDAARRFASASAMADALAPSHAWRRWAIAASVVGAGALSAIAIMRTLPAAPLASLDSDAGVSALQFFPEFQTDIALTGPAIDRRFVPCKQRNTGNVAICDLQSLSLTLLKTGTVANTGPMDGVPRSTMLLSPDRREIAYQWVRQGAIDPATRTAPALHTVRVMSVSDRQERVLFQTERGVTIRKWMPRQRALLVTEGRQPAPVRELLIPLGGGQPIEIWSRQPGDADVDLSPNGKTIVVSRMASSEMPDHDLIAFDAESRQERWRLDAAGDDRFPRWTPDGRAIAFVRDAAGHRSLMLASVTPDGPVPARQVHALGRSRVQPPIEFAPDGALFLEVVPPLRTTFLVDVDLDAGTAGRPREVDPSLAEDTFGADWGADGRIAYVRTAPRGRGAIVIRRPGGGIEREIPLNGAPLATGTQVRWSPDGRRLATRYHDGKDFVLEVLDLESGAPIATQRGRITAMHWDASGDSISFLSTEVRRFSLRSPQSTLIYRPQDGGLVNFVLDVAPSGTLLVLLRAKESVGNCVARVLPPRGSHQDLRVPDAECWAAEWVDDGRRFLISSQRSWSVGEILLIDRATSRQVRLPIETELVTDLSLSPDGRRLLYSAGNPRPTLWMVSGLPGTR